MPCCSALSRSSRLCLASPGASTAGYPLAELPLHIVLAQNWGFTSALAWNHPAWSISTELAAYLLFPLMVAAARWDRIPAGVLLACAAGLLAALYLLFAGAGETKLGARILQFGLARCLFEFALGSVLCMIWQRWRTHTFAAGAAALVSAAALVAGLALRLPEIAFVPLCFASGLLALASDRGPVARALGGGVVLYLGKISYSTYLSHFLLFILFKLAFVDATLQLGWPGLAGFVGAGPAGFGGALSRRRTPRAGLVQPAPATMARCAARTAAE